MFVAKIILTFKSGVIFPVAIFHFSSPIKHKPFYANKTICRLKEKSIVNISIDGIIYFGKTQKITKTGFLYHVGERLLTGFRSGQVTNQQTGKPTNFLNSFATMGLYFQTGAWERNNAKNVGIYWLAFRYIGCFTNPKQIKEFLPDINTNGLYHGYSFGFGVEVNNLVNLKVIYYRYLKQPEIDYSLPIYQFSFNYALKN